MSVKCHPHIVQRVYKVVHWIFFQKIKTVVLFQSLASFSSCPGLCPRALEHSIWNIQYGRILNARMMRKYSRKIFNAQCIYVIIHTFLTSLCLWMKSWTEEAQGGSLTLSITSPSPVTPTRPKLNYAQPHTHTHTHTHTHPVKQSIGCQYIVIHLLDFYSQTCPVDSRIQEWVPSN